MGARDATGRVALGLAPVAGLVTVVAAFLDDATVKTQEGLARVTFGFPVAWLSQDKSALTPPSWYFPHEYSIGSPREQPIGVAFGPLIADFVIVYLGLLAVVFIGSLILRAVRR